MTSRGENLSEPSRIRIEDGGRTIAFDVPESAVVDAVEDYRTFLKQQRVYMKRRLVRQRKKNGDCLAVASGEDQMLDDVIREFEAIFGLEV